MAANAQDQEQVGRVLFWAFSPKKATIGDDEYKALRTRYGWEEPFRAQVDATFKGMGMEILDFAEHAIFWKESAPGSSPTRPMVWDYQSDSKEMRSIEALIAFGVATTFYPRAEYLEESDEFAVRPFTVEEIHQSILHMGAMAAEVSPEGPDPTESEIGAKLLAAYTYLKDFPDVSETDGKRGNRRITVRGLIEKHLRIMKDKNRFFVQESAGWRPTPSYKNAVKLALEDPVVVELLNFTWESKA